LFSEIFLSNFRKLSIKSSQSAFVKNSHVVHSIFVSRSHQAFKAKIGVHAARASTGAIQKSSSQGKIKPLAAANNFTISSQYFGQTKVIPPSLKGRGWGWATIFSNSHL
jgi:hypothetical protein